MNRRGFLSMLGGAAAALTLDPERALWVPGKKLISIPAPAPRFTLNVGDIVTFGDDPKRYVVMSAGNSDLIGASFASLTGPGLPWGIRMPRPPLEEAVWRRRHP